MKTCNKCGEDKPESEFYVRPDTGKLRNQCKRCVIVKSKDWAEQNPDRHREICRKASRKQYWEDPEVFRAYNAARRAEDPEKHRAAVRRYRQAHPEVVQQAEHDRYWADPKKANARRVAHAKKQYRSDPNYRVCQNIRTRLRIALKGLGIKKSGPTFDLLGCSVSELRNHLESLFKPGMTWENYGPVWHIDHIKPCSKFDLIDPGQQRICFNWLNLQPLFALENIRKSDKYDPQTA